MGLRYNHIEVDDYDVTGRGGQQYTSFAALSLDVFSIPLSVMLSTELTAAEWTVQSCLRSHGDADLRRS